MIQVWCFYYILSFKSERRSPNSALKSEFLPIPFVKIVRRFYFGRQDFSSPDHLIMLPPELLNRQHIKPPFARHVTCGREDESILVFRCDLAGYFVASDGIVKSECLTVNMYVEGQSGACGLAWERIKINCTSVYGLAPPSSSK
jgi:hypothetical protein